MRAVRRERQWNSAHRLVFFNCGVDRAHGRVVPNLWGKEGGQARVHASCRTARACAEREDHHRRVANHYTGEITQALPEHTLQEVVLQFMN